MLDKDKALFVVDAHENLAAMLVGIFDAQMYDGKRYDVATLARRRAEPHPER